MIGPIRRIRMALTPPCRYCAHCVGFAYGRYQKCDCDKFLDHVERLKIVRYASVDAGLVRGTRYCRFERVEGGE